jgi:hypothetical protein
METMMDKKTNIKATEKKSAGKKTYTPPILSSYGSISTLTKSVGSTNGDGGPTMMP